MAIRTEKGLKQDKAIVDKVERILANADCPTDIKITIQAKVGEAPYISYRIEEFIVPDDYTEPGIAKREDK